MKNGFTFMLPASLVKGIQASVYQLKSEPVETCPVLVIFA